MKYLIKVVGEEKYLSSLNRPLVQKKSEAKKFSGSDVAKYMAAAAKEFSCEFETVKY